MSDASGPGRTLVVGGPGRLGFAIPMEDIRRLVSAGDLPPRHRRVTLRRLFDGTESSSEARYAEVAGPDGGTFLDLGPDVRVRTFPADSVEPIPPILATTAERWGWSGLLRDGSAFRIVLDAAWLASLAAPVGAPAAPGGRA